MRFWRNAIFMMVATIALVSSGPDGSCAVGYTAMNGNSLLTNCHAYVRYLDDPNNLQPGDQVNGAACLGYVMGVLDAHFTWQISEGSPLDPAKHFCTPEGVSPNQTARVLVKWLDDHPARLHEPAVTLVFAALRDNFPCRQPR